MAPIKNVKTGRKDAKGRDIYRGPQGGFFVINSKGNRTKPAYRNFYPLNQLLTANIRRATR
jgi:hypothetical protein